ncbi:MAG: S8 family serine peptidase [Candidatus Aenigmarchaeota archaeon]|nr:S8 family serine peptidase [Candidatus Aenigmarchaeota archaeon]
MKKLFLISILLIVSLSLILSSTITLGEGKKRVIAKASDVDKLVSEGCSVIKKGKKVASVSCPESVVSAKGLEPDLEVFTVDVSSVQQINANAVWTLGYNGTGILIAVLDTGIDTDHVELADSVAGGWNFITNTANFEDDNGHGTHVSGIITANGVNSNAIGVAPGAGVWSGKVLNAQGSGYFSDVIEAIYYVADNVAAEIISMSLGTSPPYTYKGSNCDSVLPSLTSAINYARSKGKSVVAAAGNSGGAGVSIPGCVSKVITVGAVDDINVVTSWSSKGKSLELVAPGVTILSSVIGGGYESWSGTSMATPHVSAVIALMKQKNSALTPDQVTSKLNSTATDLGKIGYDNSYGYGLVNALAAVNAS